MALFGRSFLLLWQGQLVSRLGNQAFLIATAYFTVETTGSATLVGAVMVASTLPVVALGPFGGAIADRHPRRTILIVSDLLRALTVGGLGLLLFQDPNRQSDLVVLFVLVAGLNGAMAAVFNPAVQAFIPDLVARERLAAANSMVQISAQAAILVGQALGGVLYLAWSPAGLLLLDALTFAYGALATGLIRVDRRPAPPEGGVRGRFGRYAEETREGIAYVRRHRGMVAVLLVFAGVNFLYMPVFVLLPFFVRGVLDRGPDWYGFLLAGSAAGALCGAGIAAAIAPNARSFRTPLVACVGGIAVCLLVLAKASQGWMALGLFGAIGLLSSVTNVMVITAFQAAVPPELRGRVMGLVVASSTAAVPAGMALGGLLGDLWRESIPSVFAACGTGIGGLAAVAARADLPRPALQSKLD